MDIKHFWPEWSVVELIGKGSFGSVYRIVRQKNNHAFFSALKVIRIPTSETEVQEYYGQGMDEHTIYQMYLEQVQKLENEIVVMESLKSAANVVSIEDHYIEKDPQKIGWTFYIRMELLESLDQYIKRERRMPMEEIIKMGIDISNALACCEEANIIHRDVKPGNIFRGKYGDYKLGDFGIARELEGGGYASTMIGTPNYEAPEIVLGRKYDHTVDIYALGMVLYSHLNHGRKPFFPAYPQPVTREAKEEAFAKRMSGDKLPMPDDADRVLGGIVLKACAFDPKNRYQSAKEMRDDLKLYETSQIEKNREESTMILAPSQKQRGNSKKSIIPMIITITGLAIIGTLAAVIICTGIFGRKNQTIRDSINITEEVSNEPESPLPSLEVTSDTPSPEPIATNTPTPKPTATNTSTPEPTATNTPTPNLNEEDSSFFVGEALDYVSSILFGDDSGEDVSVATNKPSPTPTYRKSNWNTIKSLKNATVGDIVKFGEFEQNNDYTDGGEEIKWYVIQVSGNKKLLLSKYALTGKEEYHDSWNSSSCRSWLNNDFYNDSFSEEQKQTICLTENVDDIQQIDIVNGSVVTSIRNESYDKVFLLSDEETDMFSKSIRNSSSTDVTNSIYDCRPTKYAKEQGIITNSNDYCLWRTRIFLEDGEFISMGPSDGVDFDHQAQNVGIRPAIWIYTEPVISDTETVRKVQEALNEAGFSCGSADGILGTNTMKALRQFQEYNNIEVCGLITEQTLLKMHINK